MRNHRMRISKHNHSVPSDKVGNVYRVHLSNHKYHKYHNYIIIDIIIDYDYQFTIK